MEQYTSTKEWLFHSLRMDYTGNTITRCGRDWISVAGLRKCGSYLTIFQDKKSVCVHAGDDWKEDEEPLLGYYDINQTWYDLLTQIANRYDEIHNKKNN